MRRSRRRHAPLSDGPVTLISPHHDDVALSLSITAACLIARGIDIKIVNCFTVSAFAPGLAGQDVHNISARRRAEDRRFARALGVAGIVTDLGFHDAPLRDGRGLRQLFRPDRFVAQDAGQLTQLSEAIAAASGAGPLVVPLALGDHIDHRLARDGAMRAAAGRPLAFFEDLPYAARSTERDIARAVDVVALRLGVRVLASVMGTEADLKAKAQHLALYRSQLTEATCRRVLEYGHARCGERLWVTPSFTRYVRECP